MRSRSVIILRSINHRGGVHRAGRDFFQHSPRHRAERLALRMRRLRNNDRLARIRRLTDLGDQRDLSEKRYAELRRHTFTAAAAEQFGARAATGANVVTHILNHAQHRRAHLLEHGHGAPHVEQRHFLGGGHYDSAGEGHLLGNS